MVKELRRCGITNYSIWNYEDELVGYYECPDLAYANRYREGSDVVRRWNEAMSGIMQMEQDAKTGAVKRFQQVFELM